MFPSDSFHVYGIFSFVSCSLIFLILGGMGKDTQVWMCICIFTSCFCNATKEKKLATGEKMVLGSKNHGYMYYGESQWEKPYRS